MHAARINIGNAAADNLVLIGVDADAPALGVLDAQIFDPDAIAANEHKGVPGARREPILTIDDRPRRTVASNRRASVEVVSTYHRPLRGGTCPIDCELPDPTIPFEEQHAV